MNKNFVTKVKEKKIYTFILKVNSILFTSIRHLTNHDKSLYLWQMIAILFLLTISLSLPLYGRDHQYQFRCLNFLHLSKDFASDFSLLLCHFLSGSFFLSTPITEINFYRPLLWCFFKFLHFGQTN